MARDVFPFADDREVIAAFLARTRKGDLRLRDNTQAQVAIRGGSLVIPGSTANMATIAWYDTAGALTGQLTTGFHFHHTKDTLNHLLLALGDERRIVRDADLLDLGERRFTYFFDGAPVNLNQPFVLAGPMTIAAYRATLKQSTTVVEGTE